MDPSLAFMDDLLDFNSDIGEGKDEEDEEAPRRKRNPNGSPDPAELNVPTSCSVPSNRGNAVFSRDESLSSSQPTGEEELEWISNKDAFPSVYTFVGSLADQSGDAADLSTPVSVLENTSTSSSYNNNTTSSTVTFMSCSDDFKIPSKLRSKCLQRRRQEISSLPLWIKHRAGAVKNTRVATEEKGNAVRKKCQHCGSEETPQWRAGPLGPKTLCNACGVRFKSGRLVPEYRPANSPTFSHELHSNSHRKVMEMRRMKGKENSTNSIDKG